MLSGNDNNVISDGNNVMVRNNLTVDDSEQLEYVDVDINFENTFCADIYDCNNQDENLDNDMYIEDTHVNLGMNEDENEFGDFHE